MKISEKILLVLSLAGLIMKYAFISGGSTLLMIALFLLSSLYYLFSAGLLNNLTVKNMFRKESYTGKSTLQIVGTILTGLCLSVAIIGIMFKSLQWAGANNLLGIGLITLVIVSTLAIFKLQKTKLPVYKSVLTRTIPCLLASALFLAISGRQLVELEFRNHPDYVRAWAASEAEPGNKELWNRREYEYYRATLSPEEFRKYQDLDKQKVQKPKDSVKDSVY